MILFLLSTFAFFGWLILTGLIAYGSYKRFKQASASALYNATLWAQSEAQRHESEIENARLRGELATLQKCYAEMSNIAKHAIRASEIATDIPKHLRMADEDSILNADRID